MILHPNVSVSTMLTYMLEISHLKLEINLENMTITGVIAKITCQSVAD